MTTQVAPRGKTTDLLVNTQSAFGTPATGNYTKTYMLSHSLVMKKPFVDDPVLGLPRTNNRDVTAPAPGLVTLEGNIKVPLDYNHVGKFLEFALGTGADTGSVDPWQHVFTSGSETLPFFTAEVEHQLSSGPIFMQYGSLIVSKFTIQSSRKAGEETMTFDLMGQQEIENSSTNGGTPTTPWARDMGAASIGAFQIGGVAAANVIEVNATYDNKVTPQNYLGQAAGLVSGFDLDGESTFSGTIKLRFRDLTMYSHAIAADSFDGTLLWSRTSNRLIQFDMPLMRVEPTGIEVTGPGGIEQTFNFRCEQDSTHPMLTVTLKNLVPTYGS